VLTFDPDRDSLHIVEVYSMDGPVRLGKRVLAVEFRNDREAQDRVPLAYRRLESAESVMSGAKHSIHASVPEWSGAPQTHVLAQEIQG